ncbi:hypothetical protein PENANT_c001G02154 [Penicillium antarcticum]|uniref:Enoyl reductase (ER) domain-containing protein n=1 Tax=Penicillium antarcticum TaxID=416450 RepID=A0A1V6QNV1_9EURO|nr:hypothetical protein PENANT_c001G02154 [Penicillium antarcticum]
MSALTSDSWVLEGQKGFSSLKLVKDRPVPDLGDFDVLVKLYAASLNYRDLVIAKGSIPLPGFTPGVVPCSDGAGIIEAVGSRVRSFKAGDKVCTHLVSRLPASEVPSFSDINSGLGQHIDGTLRSRGVFHESALVSMPPALSFTEASTLSCSGLTAWNALFGIAGHAPKEGSSVLVQGSGGVSIAALQFAVAVGATVIATTSSDAKAGRLKSLGTHHVINYRTDLAWGETAKRLTPNGRGVDIVVDVGGLSTLPQSFKAVKSNGVIALTGMLGQSEDQAAVPSLIDCMLNVCIARGLLLGTRDQFVEMNRFVAENGVKPIVDEKVFGFGDAKDAFRYLESQKHFSKVCIQWE